MTTPSPVRPLVHAALDGLARARDEDEARRVALELGLVVTYHPVGFVVVTDTDNDGTAGRGATLAAAVEAYRAALEALFA